MKIGILEPDHFSEKALKVLKKLGKTFLYENGNLKNFVSDKQILFVRLKFPIDKKLIDSAPELKVVCSPTTGLNHIDTAYCKLKKIKVISLKGETSFLKTIRATPEHTLGLIIALKRHYKTAFLNTANGEWNRDQHRGFEIYGSKIGIIGLGRVGNLLSGFLNNMGADLGYYDIEEKKPNPKIKCYESVLQLIKESDTIVLCSSYHSETGSIINKKEIDAMKDKYFINTARAELTDEKYLVDKAFNGHFKGVAIDVIQEEQTTKTHFSTWMKAATHHNVIVTPHIGGATYSSMSRTEEFVSDKLLQLLVN